MDDNLKQINCEYKQFKQENRVVNVSEKMKMVLMRVITTLRFTLTSELHVTAHNSCKKSFRFS